MMRSKRKRFYQPAGRITWQFKAFVLLSALFLVFLICSNAKVFQAQKKLWSGLADLNQNISQFLQQEAQQEVESLDSGLLEKTARDELNLQKPGEKAVAFPLVDNSTSSRKIDIESQSFFQWIIKKLK